MSELVSAIITTYMRPVEIVLRAINSVCRQTYQNIEIIVVDDSPPTYEGRVLLKGAIEKIDSRINYIQHSTNMGACAARNTGMNASNGTYVAFLDDDDEWLPEKIEQQISKFEGEEIALVYCGKMVVNDSTGKITTDELKTLSGYVFDELIYSNFIGSTSYPLIKKEALVAINGFDPLMKSAQDYDVWLRLAKNHKVNFVNLPLVRYHVHDGERISTNHQARISGQELLIQKHMNYLIQTPKAWWWRLLRLSLQYSQSGQIGKAIKIWINASVKQPLKMKTNVEYLVRIIVYYLRNLVK